MFRSVRKGLPFAIAGTLALALGLIGGLVAMAAGLLSPAPEQASIINTLNGISAESRAITTSYFEGPETTASVVADAVSGTPESRDHLNLLRDLTLTQPNVEGTYVGFPDGSFLDVRWITDDQLQVKEINFDNGTRSVHTEIIDSHGHLFETPTPRDDGFDPRTRPWYQGASNGEPHWTEAYVFFTSQEPGITHSTPVFDSTGDVVAVVGVDIALADLTDFLLARQPTANSGAAVLDGNGDIIAGTSAIATSRAGRTLITDWISSQESGATSGRIELETAMAFSLRQVSANSDRLLLIEAAEDDFLQGVRNAREGLATLATVLGAASVLLLALGSFVIWKHVKTLDRLARTDSLTGILNRAVAHEEIAAALNSDARVAIMVLDLDGFKAVNDRFGHQCGDQALIAAAERLSNGAPPGALVARLGGDEFCVLLLDHDNPDETFTALVAAAGGEIMVGDHRITLELSAGYTESPHHDANPETLLRQADTALYESKAKPGNWVTRYHSSMTLPWAQEDDLLSDAHLPRASTG